MLCLSNLYYVHAILMYPPTQQLVSHTDWHINIGKYLFWPTYKQTPSVFDSMSKIMIDLTSDSKIRGDKTENPNVLSFPANISTLDQRCFNFVDQRWNNVDPTLKMKQNPTSDFQRCTTLIQLQCPTLKQRRNNVTQCRNNVAQHWYNVDATLFQPSVDVS